MKNALILHGAANNSHGNWFQWLKKELEKKNYRVWLPDLPNAERPQADKWVDFIFSNNNWQFNEESIIIGHSAGATLVLRLLENMPNGIVIHKAILVAGYAELGKMTETFQYKRDILKTPFQWQKIKRSCKKFIFIHSNNDHYQCGEDQGKIFHQQLGGEFVIKPGEDHFNLEKSKEYKKFPLLLKYL